LSIIKQKIFFFSELEALLQNGGDPFLRNQKGKSIVTYLKDREDLQHLKSLVEQARIRKNSDTKEGANFIHKAVEEESLTWLKIYSILGGNFYSFNQKGDQPLDVALSLPVNGDVMLYVLNQSQRLLDDPNVFSRVLQFLKIQILEGKIDKSKVNKYNTLWNNLIKIGEDNGEDMKVLLNVTCKNIENARQDTKEITSDTNTDKATAETSNL
jgi:hypothetical protein